METNKTRVPLWQKFLSANATSRTGVTEEVTRFLDGAVTIDDTSEKTQREDLNSSDRLDGITLTGVSHTSEEITTQNGILLSRMLNETEDTSTARISSVFSPSPDPELPHRPLGGAVLGSLGADGSLAAGGDGRPPEDAVLLPEVGYVKKPNLTRLGFLPRPFYQDHNSDIWDTLPPQVTLDGLARTAAAHLVPNSTTSSPPLWTVDTLPALANDSSDNSTLDFIPEGYLSGYSTEHVIVTSIFVTLLMIIIIVGNGLVVVAICIDRNLKAVQNWFIASLAVSDLLVGLLIMPFSLANELMGYWYFGNILCELWLATDVLLCTASIMNLCLISLDRFWSITRAISYVKQRTKRRAILMIALVWVLSMIICFPPLVGWKRPQPMKYGKPLCVLSEDTGYVVYSTLGSFYIPLVVMVVVYFKIYLAARSRARRGLKKAQKQQQQQLHQHQQQHPPPVIDNGKSTSTTTNTTTSFSTPTRDKACKANNLLVEKEFGSFDDIAEDVCSRPESGQTSPTDREHHKEDADTHHLAVPAQGLHVHLLDEKKKLLSDDTDSACESPIKGPARRLNVGKHIHFSEDTDSTSDSPSTRSARAKFNGYRHVPRNRSSTEENMKPLLEDSQLESDSQRESEKLPVENNNHSPGRAQSVEPDGSARVTDGDQGGGGDGSGGPCQPPGEDEHLGEEISSGHEESEQLNNEQTNKKAIVLTPASFSRLNIQIRKNKLEGREKHHKRTLDDPEKQKRRIARAKERRAFIVLGIIMATFILCWLPFFSTYLVSSLTGASVPGLVFAVFFWAGYCNSALNPVTYTIFNRDFRQAFSKILFGRRSWS